MCTKWTHCAIYYFDQREITGREKDEEKSDSWLCCSRKRRMCWNKFTGEPSVRSPKEKAPFTLGFPGVVSSSAFACFVLPTCMALEAEFKQWETKEPSRCSPGDGTRFLSEASTFRYGVSWVTYPSVPADVFQCFYTLYKTPFYINTQSQSCVREKVFPKWS